ncbi:murein biosynthesis integral membrane protein MurJ [Sphingosinicella sp. LY1275]|uniref:murein biosynthesis integral membrane protein MurJ n=1 Tax=Sphingosinicella sp. LY1275 TaxID=3095379 RepID=UPI002ADED2C0|nr:murein biosynthesis integral membrane protein MurJ [Sphingosinicella sp. LY1275]MEA1013207.1 murein biosynthesis integral membrane protein MurJ [Sphingosinicella sp. LY1275]
MNLHKAIGTIGGLTMVSRILGFAREMIFARVMGAGMAADAFALAFMIPNLFRRLFGEGAFSAGFVPLFSQRLHGEGGMEEARRFAEEVLAVFMPILIAITVVFMIAMPGFALLIASGWRDDPEKFALAVELSRITFPYMIFICLVSLFSGVLNSLTRFTAAAFAPSLLNIALIGALLLVREGGPATARAMAVGVIVGGVLQLALCWGSVRRAGLKLRITPPKMTPRVKELLILILPATLGGGIYYISQFFYVYFATSLPEGSLVYLGFADRLNQLPLAIIGSALGTAILPSISRFVAGGENGEAARVQSQAVELSMLLTLPAAVALAVTSGPIVAALFQGGRFTAEDAATTALVLSIIVAGLPAYVLIKVLTPGFYARKDMKTPLYIAIAMLLVGIVLNFALIPVIGIAALAFTTALSAWLNALVLYGLLHHRGHFKIEGWLWGRLVRQLLAAGVMAAALWVVGQQLEPLFAASAGRRLVGVGALVSVGGIVYFAVAWVIGAMNRDDVLILLRRKKVS